MVTSPPLWLTHNLLDTTLSSSYGFDLSTSICPGYTSRIQPAVAAVLEVNINSFSPGGTLLITTCGNANFDTVLYAGDGCPTSTAAFACTGFDDDDFSCSHTRSSTLSVYPNSQYTTVILSVYSAIGGTGTSSSTVSVSYATPIGSVSPSRSPSMVPTQTSLATQSATATLSTSLSPSGTRPPSPSSSSFPAGITNRVIIGGPSVSGSGPAGTRRYYSMELQQRYGFSITLVSQSGDADVYIGPFAPNGTTSMVSVAAATSNSPTETLSVATTSSIWNATASVWYIEVLCYTTAAYTIQAVFNLGDAQGAQQGLASRTPQPTLGAIAPLDMGVTTGGVLASDSSAYFSFSVPQGAPEDLAYFMFTLTANSGDPDLLLSLDPPTGSGASIVFNDVLVSTDSGSDSIIISSTGQNSGYHGGPGSVYYIKVHAYTASSYNLRISSPAAPITATSSATSTSSLTRSRTPMATVTSSIAPYVTYVIPGTNIAPAIIVGIVIPIAILLIIAVVVFVVCRGKGAAKAPVQSIPPPVAAIFVPQPTAPGQAVMRAEGGGMQAEQQGGNTFYGINPNYTGAPPKYPAHPPPAYPMRGYNVSGGDPTYGAAVYYQPDMPIVATAPATITIIRQSSAENPAENPVPV